MQSYFFGCKIGLAAPKNAGRFAYPFLIAHAARVSHHPEHLRYQTVPASLLETDIRQHFHLTEADRVFLTSFRGAANRLGSAIS